MSYTVKSHDSTAIRGNIGFASGTWASGGTSTTPNTIETGLGELIYAAVSVHTAVGTSGTTNRALRYRKNYTKNGTADDGSIGIYETVGSGDAGEWFAIGYIS